MMTNLSETKKKLSQLEQPVSATEQAQYDEFVINGYKLIYESGALVTILNRLHVMAKLGLAVEGLARITSDIVERMVNDLVQSNLKLGDGVAYHGSVELIEELVELAKRHAIYDFNETELEAGFFRALEIFLENNQNSLPMSKEQLEKDRAFLAQIDEENLWESYLPGLEKVL